MMISFWRFQLGERWNYIYFSYTVTLVDKPLASTPCLLFCVETVELHDALLVLRGYVNSWNKLDFQNFTR